MEIIRKLACAALLATATVLVLSTVASSVDWPKKTVEIIVPAGAGGDTDFNARLFAQYLGKELGGNFVVSNVSGNGGATGTRKVKDSRPDGNTVLFYHSAFVVNKLSGAANYGFEAFDFACIGAMSMGNCITVRADTGFKKVADLIDYSRKHPGELTIAAQTGATTHASALLLREAGADLTIVDSGSASDRLAALLGGHVDGILNAYGNIRDYIADGSLTPIGLDGLRDFKDQNIQSVVTQGYDVGFPFYYFFAFPKGTDKEIIAKFSDAVKNIVENNAEYAQKIHAAYYQTPTYLDSTEGLTRFGEVEKKLSTVKFK